MADEITVTVDSAGKPTCDPDVLPVGKSNGNVVIKWKMAKDNTSKLYEVTNVDINDPDGEFSGSGKDTGGGWKVTDKNDNTKTYTYDITVGLKSTGETTTHDPSIRNGGRNQSV